MNNDIEDLVRDAVRRQEELAVDPDRVRAALPARAARQTRAHRTRAIAVAAAAFVAVAVAVPVVVLRDSGSDAGPAASLSTPPTTVPTAGAAPPPDSATFPLRYRPTWLPPGVSERSRSVPLTSGPDAKASTVRIWQPPSAGEENLGLYAYASPEGSEPKAPPVVNPGSGAVVRDREVDINGKPGRYDGDATVTWRVDANTKLMLVAPGLGLSEEDLLRVARSVEPDDARVHVPLRTGPLPAGVVTHFANVEGTSPTSWEASVFADRPFDAYVHVEVATLDRGADAGGETVTVRGRTGHLATPVGDTSTQAGYRTDWVLTVDLGDGRRLTVRAGSGLGAAGPALTRAEVIAIAEQAEVDANPDLGWLGG
ncbi:hypothetical protein [Saccharothrix hoggarensis]|uniref:DUF4367 domain-containing protein n=1 Tax=Saccharothrix hoggarensis TaxID=913853 RepID=A0ABW3QVB4_9PSEU